MSRSPADRPSRMPPAAPADRGPREDPGDAGTWLGWDADEDDDDPDDDDD